MARGVGESAFLARDLPDYQAVSTSRIPNPATLNLKPEFRNPEALQLRP